MIRYSPTYRVGTIRYEGETRVGVRGPAGPGLEFRWDGTRLGVRTAGETEYRYADLLGPAGKPGPQGEPGQDGTLRFEDLSPEQQSGLKGADGYTPQRGVDYWTTADRQSMVQDVLAALPVYQGEVSSV